MNPSFENLAVAAADLVDLCRRRNIMIATAESCTGGLVAAILTEVPGSSAVVDRAFVTYSNAAKTEMLGVPADLIARQGAVSEAVALSMISGVLNITDVEIAVAITGIAGPDGGTEEKPVGLVHLAAGTRAGAMIHSRRVFQDTGRHLVRLAAVGAAFAMIRELAMGSAYDKARN